MIFKQKSANKKNKKLIADSGLFDSDYYLKENPDVKETNFNPLDHYLLFGGFEGRNPSEKFNTVFYLETYPDVIREGVNPLLHYILYGKSEGRKLLPEENESIPTANDISNKSNIQTDKVHAGTVDDPLKNEMDIIRESNYFDNDYYLSTYPDVKEKNSGPVEHFCRFGYKELRNPSEKFNTKFYMEEYPDVRDSGVNPLVHYIRFGEEEGRMVLPEDVIRDKKTTKQIIKPPSKKTEEEPPEDDMLSQRNSDLELIRNSVYFDEKYYLANYPYVSNADISPLEHFYFQGWKEGKNPGPEFETKYYINKNPDVKSTKKNPLVHYLKFGKDEGRKSKEIEEIITEDNAVFEGQDKSELSNFEEKVKLLSFYLPQFHPIPENDKWWGRGFTEWYNVVRAKPQFEGHYQPHLPIDIGFYDLRVPEIMEQQIEMAKIGGLAGFCFYYYWFDGKRLLDRPLDMFLEHKEWDFKFCVCWANENWTRRWDGMENDILIAQNHSKEDDLKFIEDYSRYTRDSRYIRIDNKPLLIIYRPDIFPDIKKSVKFWRDFYKRKYNEELVMAMIQTFGSHDPNEFGFDYAIEFPPHNVAPEDLTTKFKLFSGYSGRINNVRTFMDKSREKLSKTSYNLFRGVMLNWDNTPRKGNSGNVYLNNPPHSYREWLFEACKDTLKNKPNPDERIVFINAWNEWAEGTHLEPDEKYGYGYLNATKSALRQLAEYYYPKVSVVVPNFNHEAYLRQRLDSIYDQTYKNLEVVLLDDKSTDSSLKILEEYQAKYNDCTQLFINEVNSGNVFIQWIKGIEKSTGDLIWIAESDDFCGKGFLEKLVPLFEDEALSLAYSNILFVDKNGEPHSRTFHDYVNGIDPEKWKSSYIQTAYFEVRKALGLKNTIPNVSAVLFRRPGKLDLFNQKEWFNMKICGDWIFYLNILKGGKIAFSADTLNYYRIHDDNASVKTYNQDVYYTEHETVASEIARNYDVPYDILFQNRNIIKDFYLKFKSKDENRFNELFSEKRMIESAKERKINIAISILSFTHGGAEIMPIRLANQLKEMGYPSTIHSLEFLDEEKEIRKLLRGDIPIVRIKTAADLYEFLMEFGIDVFNTHSQLCQDLFTETVQKFPFIRKVVKHVGTLHGGYEIMDDKYQKVHIPQNNKYTDFWTYVAGKNLIPFKNLGVDIKEKSKKIVNGLATPCIGKLERESLGISTDSFVLCVVSRAIPEKGWLETIEIVKNVRAATGKDVNLLLLGTGEIYDQLIETDLPAFIHLLGFKDNPCDYFAISDMGVLLSTYKAESFPLSIVESLMVGKPVIASNLGEIRNMLTINCKVAGEVFELVDEKIPAEKVVKIIGSFVSDKNQYEKACALAIEISKRFDLKNVSNEYINVYEKLVKVS